MTALETYVKDKKRQDYIKQVRKKIDKLGIEYIYYQFISVTGRIVGKGVPADHWESVANKGFQLVYGATANLFTNFIIKGKFNLTPSSLFTMYSLVSLKISV